MIRVRVYLTFTPSTSTDQFCALGKTILTTNFLNRVDVMLNSILGDDNLNYLNNYLPAKHRSIICTGRF